MGLQVIPIPNEVVSHSLSFPFPILCFIPIHMGFPWDSRSHWESHSHAHLYLRQGGCYAISAVCLSFVVCLSVSLSVSRITAKVMSRCHGSLVF